MGCPIKTSYKYESCPITIQSFEQVFDGTIKRVVGCRLCARIIETEKGKRCSKQWWVCPDCYPKHCTYLEPENENPVVGKVEWITPVQ